MLHIVLTILKILGIIILALLALVLVLILCVLFVPVRYSAKVKYNENLTVDARISFLFRILSLRFRKNEDMSVSFRIFGINTHFFDGDKDKRSLKSRKKQMEKMEKDTEMFEQLSEEIHQTHDNVLSGEIEKENKEEKDVNGTFGPDSEPFAVGKDTEQMRDNRQEKQSDETGKIKDKISLIERIKKFILSKLLKIKYIFRRFCDTIKNILKKIKWWKDFLQDEKTKQAIRDVKTEAIKLIKHIKPRKIKGYLYFGFENPCNTGKLYGLICMFYGKMPKDFLLKADFENKVLEGDLLIKGRIHVFYLLIIAFRLYRNRNLKQVIEKRRTYGRE